MSNNSDLIKDNRLLYLDKVQWVGKNGRRVRVTGGLFKGAEGVKRSVRRDTRACVEIAGVAAVAKALVICLLLKGID